MELLNFPWYAFLTRSEGRFYRSNSFRKYWPEIWWDDAQYCGADCYVKWWCAADFCAFHGTLKFSKQAKTRYEGRRYRFNSLRILVFGLKFFGMMHRSIFGIPRNFQIFHDRLRPRRWNWENHITAWNVVAWCSLPWNRSLFERATLS